MIVLFCMIAGAVYGGWRAKRRGGNGFDAAQYAAVFAIIGAIVGLFVTIGVERLL
ncbi:apolipoprotein acyltransferase [Roseicitreum antarcticum]|uniref:PEP-CTERM protein-sorting domain-containing protein n=1 Tax=Roseicitreum antarcticum TaxID=564137 RepID=A0A1H2TVD2_9RHOB|nr:apolipoprotein acyltransferase [Roseicitreum antarcticum]SDW47718.1 hypothetical protein SAMN04488238_102186 [Roseicitreum antarcticum]